MVYKVVGIRILIILSVIWLVIVITMFDVVMIFDGRIISEVRLSNGLLMQSLTIVWAF